LDAVYAGELSLKNIEQSVSAYHVWPPEIQPQKIPEQFSEAIFSLVTPLNTTLKVFSAHPQSHRIKKLLYAAHQGIWENSTDTLKSVSLKLLVESLTSRNANLIECQDSLNAIIKTLNRPERYRKVAQVILENIKDFYIKSIEDSLVGLYRASQWRNTLNGSQNISAQNTSAQHGPVQHGSANRNPLEIRNSLNSIIKSINPSQTYVPIPKLILGTLKEFYAESSDGSRIDVSHPSQLASLMKDFRVGKAGVYVEISNRLDVSKNNIYVKQLLYYVCCGQWETHLDRIQAVPMLSLIQGLHQQVGSISILQKQIFNILSQLESRATYTSAANEIVRESRSLYRNSSKPSPNIIYLRREKSLV
ncbi:MAG: hypothetical protein AAFZ17_17075, partial [Cyanobacteria bacterium J06650_10]